MWLHHSEGQARIPEDIQQEGIGYTPQPMGRVTLSRETLWTQKQTGVRCSIRNRSRDAQSVPRLQRHDTEYKREWWIQR